MVSQALAHNPRTLLHIAPYLRSRSVDPVEIFRRAGMSPSVLLDANGWVPRETCFKLGNEMYAATGERCPGADVGRRFGLSDLGTWGIAVAGAATLREACETASRGIGLVHQGTDLRLRDDGNVVTLSLAFRGSSTEDPWQHILGAMAVLRSVALLAGIPDAVGAQFSRPSGRAGERLEETFGPALQFGCAMDAITIGRELLELPVQPRTVDGVDPVETAFTLCDLVKKMLPYERVTLESVAVSLRMSPRTLQRRLRDFGFSFEQLIDDVRRVEAIRRIQARDGSTIEIAFMLGYSDQAHFTRAFRRWTGMAPRAYARRTCIAAE